MRKPHQIINSNPEKSESYFSEKIIDNSRSMVSIINRDYIYEKVNKPFCSAHKVTTGSVIGKSLSDVWGKQTFKERIKNKLDLCFKGRTVRYEASFKTPKTGKRYYEVVFRPIKAENGEITHLMAETFDVTSLKQSRKTANEFQKEIKVKEIEFENRLSQAQRLESIGVFAGGIAHDFNNILATISGYAEILHDDLPKNSLLRKNAEKIMSAVNRGKSLTNQILTFSRQTGQERSVVKISEILDETLEFIRTVAPPVIRIIKDQSESEAAILADPTQLFRVFLNLLTNAVQSMEETGGTLTVKTDVVKSDEIRSVLKQELKVNEYARITVGDTGIGMDSSLVARIFDPFYTTKEVGKGTGLGLSVVYGIVTELGGEILVSSRKKSGSVFAVYLPLVNKT